MISEEEIEEDDIVLFDSGNGARGLYGDKGEEVEGTNCGIGDSGLTVWGAGLFNLGEGEDVEAGAGVKAGAGWVAGLGGVDCVGGAEELLE